MSVHTHDQGLLIQYFQDSLTGAPLEWYMKLERAHIRCWNDLVRAFVRHYNYNRDLAPNRTQLQSLSQGPSESFKEYAQKWRELAARVQPPLLERELIDMFMNTLQGPFYDRMIGATSARFTELVMARERIEAGMKIGRIQVSGSGTSSSGSKKPFVAHPKKREGETNFVHAYERRNRRQYQQQINDVSILANAPQQQPQQARQQNAPRGNNNYQQRPPRKFDTLPMSYAQAL